MSPGLVRVTEAARRSPGEMKSLAHHIDVDALRRAFNRVRKNAAVGVDGVTKEQYGENLEDNLRDLHQRMKSMRCETARADLKPILRADAKSPRQSIEDARELVEKYCENEN